MKTEDILLLQAWLGYNKKHYFNALSVAELY